MNPVRRRLIASIAFALTALYGPTQASDLLPAAQAFALTGRLDGGQVILRYRIADGYYLYRDKFRFSVEPATVRMGKPTLPRGLMKKDEFFGRVETYRGEVAIRVPLRQQTASEPIIVTAVSQGCADVGVCYPPLRVSLALTPGQPETNATAPGAQAGKSLLDALGGKP